MSVDNLPMAGKFFDQDGNPIDLLTWGQLYDDRPGCLVAEDDVPGKAGPLKVVTAWHGLREPLNGRDVFFTVLMDVTTSHFLEVGQWPNKEIALQAHQKIVTAVAKTGQPPTGFGHLLECCKDAPNFGNSPE